MFGIGPQELFIILLIVLLLFGGRKIPEIARGIGRGMREFRKARDEIDQEPEVPEGESGVRARKNVEGRSAREPAASAKEGDDKNA